MKPYIALIVAFGLFGAAFGQGPSELRKITVVRSTSVRLDDRFQNLLLPKGLDNPDLVKLRDYVNAETKLQSSQDPQIVLDTLAWVSRQWKHDGNNPAGKLTSYEILQNAKAGTRYRCVEYGKVTADILKGFGYVSREIGMLSPDAAYGGYGCAHATTEVWSNKLDKWIWVDPQFGLYAKHGGLILNYYEVYKLHKGGRLKDVEFTYADPGSTTPAERKKAIDEYVKFVSRYFGQITMPAVRSGESFYQALMLDTKEQALTFQSFPSGWQVFTRDPADMYFPINHALIIPGFQRSAYVQVEGFNQWDAATFERRKGEVAARPDLSLSFQHNMPWFDHFEVRIDGGPWSRVEDPKKLELTLKDGLTRIEAVAVNQAGLRGVPCSLDLRYARG
jgi:hypothetical protein